jgi:uncharacterized phage infection (PIP) family protein YhgE
LNKEPSVKKEEVKSNLMGLIQLKMQSDIIKNIEKKLDSMQNSFHSQFSKVKKKKEKKEKDSGESSSSVDSSMKTSIRSYELDPVYIQQ